jgi:hypothetical protein
MPSPRYASIGSDQRSGQPKTAAPLGFIQCTSTQMTSPNAQSAAGTSQGRQAGLRRQSSTIAIAATSARSTSPASTRRGMRPQAAMNSRVAA